MKRSGKAGSGFLYFYVIVSLILMMWVVDVSLAGGPYTIAGSVTPADGGTITPVSAKVSEGGNAEFNVMANPGYYISKVTVNGSIVYTQSLPLSYTIEDNRPTIGYTYTIKGVYEDYTMVATLKPYYNLVSQVGTPGGEISPAGMVPASAGTARSYTVTPLPGYRIRDVTVNGDSWGALDSVEIPDIFSDYEIVVYFEPDTPLTHTITAKAHPGGSIFPSGEVRVEHVRSQQFAVTANPGHRISKILMNGVPLPNVKGSYYVFEIPAVTTDHTIDAFFEKLPPMDFGDAPAPYPTLLKDGGARHTIVDGIHLGSGVDAEPDGQPHPEAMGDGGDEDGVTFTSALMRGEGVTVIVVASRSGFLKAWIDFNRDGDWADRGERIFPLYEGLVAGPNNLEFNVPVGATLGKTFARFRFSTSEWDMEDLSYYGPSEDGEVEDYQVEIVTLPMDFGDAPDPPYDTLRWKDGARHIIVDGVHLGSGVDAEPDGQPHPEAMADSGDDGLIYDGLMPGKVNTITVNASVTGRLSAWIDFNRDGDWDDPGDPKIPADQGEQISADVWLLVGKNNLRFYVPEYIERDSTFYARFRFSTRGGLSYYGLAQDGEVEDHMLKSIPPDLPKIAVDPPSHDFGMKPLNSSSDKFFEISNPGDAPLEVGLQTEGSGDFHLTDEPYILFPISLEPGQTFKLGVTYKPSSPGEKSATIVLFHNVPGLGPVEIGLQGTAVPMDFGDAPAPYPTLLKDDGARHIIVDGGPYLGRIPPDSEKDGRPHLMAVGDDAYNNRDEGDVLELSGYDDIFFLGPLFPGEATVLVGFPSAGILNAWIDFNIDGDWKDPEEQIFTNLRIPPDLVGTYESSEGDISVLAVYKSSGGDITVLIPFPVPEWSGRGGISYARFRFSSKAGLSYTGVAPDGEVQDHAVYIYVKEEISLSSSPEPNPVGTDHTVTATLYEVHPDGRRKPVSGREVFVDRYGPGFEFEFTDHTGWMRVTDRDGKAVVTYKGVRRGTDSIVARSTDLWGQEVMSNTVEKEWLAAEIAVDSQSHHFGMIPPSSSSDKSFEISNRGDVPLEVTDIKIEGDADFHLTNPDLGSFTVKPRETLNLGVTFEPSSAGEKSAKIVLIHNVPDIDPVEIGLQGTAVLMDFGDAPATYPTLLKDDGARHIIVDGGPFLGNVPPDSEVDGQPSQNALGDKGGDETVYLLKRPLLPGDNTIILDQSAGPGGFLNAWVDFNIDDNWDDPGEQIFIDEEVPSVDTDTQVELKFKVPEWQNDVTKTKSGNTYARFRISSKAGLSYKGLAPDGEVEDTMVTIYMEEKISLSSSPEPNPVGTEHTVTATVKRVHADGTEEPVGGKYVRCRIEEGPHAGRIIIRLEATDSNGNVPFTYKGTFPGTDSITARFTDSLGTYQVSDAVKKTWTAAKIAMDSQSHDFGMKPPNSSSKKSFEISNPGDAPLEVTDIKLEGDVADFHLTYPRPFTLKPGETLKLGVTFAPLSVGEKSATITLTHNVPGLGPVEIELLGIVSVDFGDAPAPYRTLLKDGGARHTIVDGIHLGSGVDAEPDGQPHPEAMGDGDDEDGVTFTSALMRGEDVTVIVIASRSGFLKAWIDFNGDGDWSDPEEQIFFAIDELVAGPNNLNFDVPVGATLGKTFARFRFGTSEWEREDLSFYGPAHDGEVEDYQVEIVTLPMDFGDAPDPPYDTLRWDDGARHIIVDGVHLGSGVDAEPSGQPHPEAMADSGDDGLIYDDLMPGKINTIAVNASVSGRLSAWIDFNRDGDWDDPGDPKIPADQGEQIFADASLLDGRNNLRFYVPENIERDSTFYARFRFSTRGGLSYRGRAQDGEVEDHMLKSIPPDLPKIAVDPPSHDFGLKPLNSSSDKFFEISNPGDAPLEVTVKLEGDVANFHLTNPDLDSFTLKPGETYKLGVTYKPSSAGMKSAVIFLGYSVPGLGPVSMEPIELRGIAELMDFGDAPAPYPTLLKDDGARHIIFFDNQGSWAGRVWLGRIPDDEGDGQPDKDALGDDSDGYNDEWHYTDTTDVRFLSPLVPDASKVTLYVLGGGFVNGWVDFNMDGDWADLGEQILIDAVLDPDRAENVVFKVPAGQRAGRTYARFRVSSKGGLSYTGLAPDGEVVDMAVKVYMEEKISLTSSSKSNPVGTDHTVTATIYEVHYPGGKEVPISGTLRSSIGLNYQRELDNGSISEDLESELLHTGCLSGSPDISVSIEEKGKRWLITIKHPNFEGGYVEDYYHVVAEEGKLKIYSGRYVDFEVVAGPHTGRVDRVRTDMGGKASYTYKGSWPGTDTIVARFTDSWNTQQISNQIKKKWTVSSFPGINDDEKPSRVKIKVTYSSGPGKTHIIVTDLFDEDTVIMGRSDPHEDGDASDTGGTPVGTAGTMISDADFLLVPHGFQGPSGTREVHTEMRKLSMVDSSGVAIRAGTDMGLPLNPGEMESLSGASGDPDLDFPAESFFDVFLEIDLPETAERPAVTVYNSDPLLLISNNVPEFPFKMIYVLGNEHAVPLYHRDSNPDGAWNAGDFFGWLTTAIIGVDFDPDDPDDTTEFEARVLEQSDLPIPPVVSDIPDQAIEEGGTFAGISLDDYVWDPDNADAEIVWTCSGNIELSVTISDDRVASIAVPDPEWSGSETITFTATDPGGLTASDVVILTANPRPVLLGDVSKDGSVRSGDAILALRIAAGLMEPTEYQKRAADMNGDGEVRANDAISILRKAAGL